MSTFSSGQFCGCLMDRLTVTLLLMLAGRFLLEYNHFNQEAIIHVYYIYFRAGPGSA